MNRLSFLKNLVAMALGSQVKVPLEEKLIPLPRELLKTATFTHQQYGLSFRVTREFMEDNYYGVGIGETVQMFNEELRIIANDPLSDEFILGPMDAPHTHDDRFYDTISSWEDPTIG